LASASVSDYSTLSSPFASDLSGDELFDLMRSRFDVMVEDVSIASHRLRIATVRHPEDLLDAITIEEFAKDERLPYWAELWTSALVLSERLLRDKAMRSVRVLEIGCGLGLAGIAAAQAGAHVDTTDYDRDALMFARWNALTNLSPDALARVHHALLDWREPPGSSYKYIIGADIVYERRNFEPLLKLFGSALKTGGSVLLAEPDRSIGSDFFAVARDRGFCVDIETTPCERRGRTSTVRLAVLRKDTGQ
jgi:ETFB lysine methyltransferase